MNDVYMEPQFENTEPYARYQATQKYVNINTGNHPPAGSTDIAGSSYVCAVNPTKTPTPSAPETQWPRLWKTFAVVAMFLLFFLSALAIAGMVKVHQLEAGQSGYGSSATSCLHLRNQGETRSGFYLLQPNQDEAPFETYCDMATSGGGWTLVASVHENDIEGKCTTADMWFSRERPNSDPFISRNWENKRIFGSAKSATSDDYKNAGYYAMDASDVLVRHAPNNEEVEETQEGTFLEYHTENNFLKGYGGNLHGVYSNHYNLSVLPQSRIFFTENNAEMLDALAANASDIISAIPDFYRYQYGSSTPSNSLSRGNDNMFSSYGMQVYVYPCQTITYGRTHTDSCGSNDLLTSSRKTTPFFALTTIGNKWNRRSYMYYQVRAYRYSNDTVRQYDGTLTHGLFTLRYNAYCRYGNAVPSVCDVIYAVSNKEEWKSSDFSFSTLSASSTDVKQDVENTPTNIALGYTMLSRPNGLSISQSQINDVSEKILKVLSKFPSVAKSCEDPEINLVQPVKYTIGGATVLGGVPTSLRSHVTSGFMQFRARNRYGVAFAFCPAVRVNTCDSQYLCVGGVGSGISIENYCNDYLYWTKGYSLSSLSFYDPGSYSHSRQYVESTILIFYR